MSNMELIEFGIINMYGSLSLNITLNHSLDNLLNFEGLLLLVKNQIYRVWRL